MTFLNPFVLFGLAAAGIPILIHLLNKRKLRTIEFSTLAFLKELQKNKMRTIAIRQWLLLILRTLVIIFLVLAFSRPVLKGNFSTLGSHAKTSLLIILDNTASMTLHDKQGTYLDQAKEKAQQIISLMQEGDDAAILRLSDVPSATMQTLSHDKQKLQSLINETALSVVHRTIDDALRTASTLLQQSKNFNKEVYILTDGQLTTLRSSEPTKMSHERLFEPLVKFFYFTIGASPSENVGIERITIPPTLLQVQKPVTVSAVVKNYGTTRKEHYLASMSVNGTTVMQKNISLNGGEQGTLNFTFTPSRPGFITGVIELEDDEFEADNKRYFSVYIPEQISVTVVTQDQSQIPYIATALEVTNTVSSFVSTKQIAPSQLSTTVLSGSDVLVLAGVKTIAPSQQELLHQFISRGGALIFFPSSDSQFVAYDYLHVIGLDKVQLSSSQPYGSHFDKVDLEFPIFSGMFEPDISTKRSIESPDVFRSLTFPLSKSARPIITLSNNAPFVWLTEYGKGKVLGYAVPASTGWSNFPLKGIFVPLLNQSIIYLASQIQLVTLNIEYFPGEPIEFSSAQMKKFKEGAVRHLQLADPEQRMSPLQSYSKVTENGTSRTVFVAEPLLNVGHYCVIAQRETVMAFAANINPDESDGTRATETEIHSLLTLYGIAPNAITLLAPHTPLQDLVLQSRFGIELWKYFVLLAVLCAVLEMVIAREKKEQ